MDEINKHVTEYSTTARNIANSGHIGNSGINAPIKLLYCRKGTYSENRRYLPYCQTISIINQNIFS